MAVRGVLLPERMQDGIAFGQPVLNAPTSRL
jgi:hypothetical protein